MGYTPVFGHIKGTIGTHNRSKFDQHNLSRLQIVNFQSILVSIPHPRNGHFGGFGELNSPKYCLILVNFSAEVVFKEKKTVLEEPLKNSFFYRNGRYPKFAHIWSNPILAPEDSRNQAK